MLTAILANCICMAAEDPLQRDPRQTEVLEYIDFVFMALFTLEASPHAQRSQRPGHSLSCPCGHPPLKTREAKLSKSHSWSGIRGGAGRER